MMCCNHDHDDPINKEEDKHDHPKHHHGIVMLLLCLIPMGLIFMWLLLDKTGRSSVSPLTYVVFLLCPLMHVLMMFGLFKSHKNKD